jgi:hypothetical protein
MTGLILISFSLPTLSFLCDLDVVPVLAILYDSHKVCASTVEKIFRNASVEGLTTRRADLQCCPDTRFQSLNGHLQFLRESSLGGVNPVLKWRVDYQGISDARQATVRAHEERGRAWKFKAVVDVAHHPDLINSGGEIPSDYFQMRIVPQIENWVEEIEAWELISYSVPQTRHSLNARGSIPVGGFFRWQEEHESAAKAYWFPQGACYEETIPSLDGGGWSGAVLHATHGLHSLST